MVLEDPVHSVGGVTMDYSLLGVPDPVVSGSFTVETLAAGRRRRR